MSWLKNIFISRKHYILSNILLKYVFYLDCTLSIINITRKKLRQIKQTGFYLIFIHHIFNHFIELKYSHHNGYRVIHKLFS